MTLCKFEVDSLRSRNEDCSLKSKSNLSRMPRCTVGGRKPGHTLTTKHVGSDCGQGNRVKKLCGDEACEEVVIPGGNFAAEAEGILSPGSPD